MKSIFFVVSPLDLRSFRYTHTYFQIFFYLVSGLLEELMLSKKLKKTLKKKKSENRFNILQTIL